MTGGFAESASFKEAGELDAAPCFSLTGECSFTAPIPLVAEPTGRQGAENMLPSRRRDADGRLRGLEFVFAVVFAVLSAAPVPLLFCFVPFCLFARLCRPGDRRAVEKDSGRAAASRPCLGPT